MQKQITRRIATTVAASLFSIALLVEGCAGRQSTEQNLFSPPKSVQNSPSSQQKSPQQQKTGYDKPEAILRENTITLTDRQGIEHTIDLSGKMKEHGLSSLKGGRLNQVDTQDGGTVCNVYPPNSSAPIMILISSSGEERVISGPPMSQ